VGARLSRVVLQLSRYTTTFQNPVAVAARVTMYLYLCLLKTYICKPLKMDSEYFKSLPQLYLAPLGQWAFSVACRTRRRARAANIERCPHCGWQALGSFHFDPNDARREVWNGKWPGEEDCERLGFYSNGDPDFPDLNRLFTGNGGSGVVWVLAPDSFLPLDNWGCQLFFIVGGQRIQRRSQAGMG
jgi:hypothetical protein